MAPAPDRTRLFVTLPMASEPGSDFAMLLRIARAAEAAGIDGLIVTDHVVMGPDTDAYQWGPFPFPPEDPWLEPLTVLSALAAVTSRITLATGILIAPLRPAPLLAKTVATIDALAPGRVELGVGTGWQAIEFEASDLTFEERGQQLDRVIENCRALWGQQPATVHTRGGTVNDVWCVPTPRGPSVSFSGTLTARNIRRIVRWGDGWIPIMGSAPRAVAEGIDRLGAALRSAGRDPSTIRIRVPVPSRSRDGALISLDAAFDGVGALVDAGVNDVSVPGGRFGVGNEPERWCEAVATRWSKR